MKKLVLSILISGMFAPMMASAADSVDVQINVNSGEATSQDAMPCPPPPQGERPMMGRQGQDGERPMMGNQGQNQNGERPEMPPRRGQDSEANGERPPMPPKGDCQPPRDGNQMGKKFRDSKGSGFESLTLEEKESIFNNRIEKMEEDLTKRLEMVKKLKSMSLEEKEKWFEENRKPMRHKHDKMKKMCDRLDFSKKPDFDGQRGMERMKESKDFKKATPEMRKRMEERMEAFNNLPPEEKQARYEERMDRMKSFCEKM